jgi:hypothetical protein
VEGSVYMYIVSVLEQVLRYSWNFLLPHIGLCISQYWVISSYLHTRCGHIFTLIPSTLKMEEACSSKTSVSTYKKIWYQDPANQTWNTVCLYHKPVWEILQCVLPDSFIWKVGMNITSGHSNGANTLQVLHSADTL